MKISELNNEEILNFLMISEFEENYSPSELKYLLMKFKFFYRVSQARNEQIKLSYETILDNLQEVIDLKSLNEAYLQSQIVKKDESIESLKQRKLTWTERITGKIIKEDEDRGL